MKLFAHIDGAVHEIDMTDESGHLVAKTPSGDFVMNLDDQSGVIRTVFLSGGNGSAPRKLEFGWTRRDQVYRILIDGISYEVELRDSRAERAAQLARPAAGVAGTVEVRAPIPGQVSNILAPEGTRVEKDQAVLTLDAMKLQNEIQAPRAGVVRSLPVRAGTAVDKGQILFVLE